MPSFQINATPALVPFANQISKATFLDVNTRLYRNGKPELLPDEQAIKFSSIYNILNCPIGDRGRIFQPTYGSLLYHFLQEPVHPETSDRIKALLVQAIEKWEPRIRLDLTRTAVVVADNGLGYNVTVAFIFLINRIRTEASYYFKAG